MTICTFSHLPICTFAHLHICTFALAHLPPYFCKMKITPLSEGTFTIDHSKVFVPFDVENDHMRDRSSGSLLVEIQPFVVETSRDVLLLDTGLGYEVDGELQLIQNLRAAGIDPDSITKVLMSHLHKDHAGAVTRSNAVGQRELTFPRAKYYVQKAELAYALEKGKPSYIPEEIADLQQSSQVEWLDGNGLIDGYIRYEITGAHSKFHQVFWIEDEGKTLFFGADDAPQLQQMKTRFAAKYDFNGKKAMELRSQWWEEAQEGHWEFLFYHDIRTPVHLRQ